MQRFIGYVPNYQKAEGEEKGEKSLAVSSLGFLVYTVVPLDPAGEY